MNKQQGASLIYVLFISSMMVVVLTVVLLAMTQHHRHIAAYEKRQYMDYLTEGAFEVVIQVMEEYVNPAEDEETGVYYFMKNIVSHLGSNQPILDPLILDGEHHVGIAGEILQEEDNLLLARIYSLDNPNLFRLIEAEAQAVEEEDEIPIFDDGRPEFEIEEGNIYIDDGDSPSFLNEDQIENIIETGSFSTEHRLVIPSSAHPIFVSGNELHLDADQGIYLGTDLSNDQYHNIILSSSQGDIFIGEGSELSSSQSLYIQAQNGHIVLEDAAFQSSHYGKIELHAGKWVSMVDADITSDDYVAISANDFYGQKMTLTSRHNGFIQLLSEGNMTLNETNLDSSNRVEIKTNRLTADDVIFTSRSNAPISLAAEEMIHLSRARLNSSSVIAIHGAENVSILDSYLSSSSNGPIEISSNSDLNLSSTILQSANRIRLESNGDLTANNASFSTISWTDVIMFVGGDLSVQMAHFNADRDILFQLRQASSSIYFSGASFRSRNNRAQATPSGVGLVGTPAFGCISNGTETICAN